MLPSCLPDCFPKDISEARKSDGALKYNVDGTVFLKMCCTETKTNSKRKTNKLLMFA